MLAAHRAAIGRGGGVDDVEVDPVRRLASRFGVLEVCGKNYASNLSRTTRHKRLPLVWGGGCRGPHNGSVMMASISLSLGAATPLKLTVTLWFGWNEH